MHDADVPGLGLDRQSLRLFRDSAVERLPVTTAAAPALWPRGDTVPLPAQLPDRFWAKVDKTDGCWNWTGASGRSGYGNFKVASRTTVRAHRAAYAALVGPIPSGLTLDHLCRNRSCVNPAHLEPVTTRENLLRGTSVSAKNAVKTHCKVGHPYNDANTYEHRGQRNCRQCKNAAQARWKARRA